MPKKITLSSAPPAVGVAMCPGTTVAYGRRLALCRTPHELGVPNWGSCWKCNLPLGCSTCTTSNGLEILCQPCAAWGTKLAFLHHGPIVANVKVPRPARYDAYPVDWKRDYEPTVGNLPSLREIHETLSGIKVLP